MLIAILYGYITIHLFSQSVCSIVRDTSTYPVFHILLRFVLYKKSDYAVDFECRLFFFFNAF